VEPAPLGRRLLASEAVLVRDGFASADAVAQPFGGELGSLGDEPIAGRVIEHAPLHRGGHDLRLFGADAAVLQRLPEGRHRTDGVGELARRVRGST
jgi:hypothetical protein